jgi:hypothetical protein
MPSGATEEEALQLGQELSLLQRRIDSAANHEQLLTAAAGRGALFAEVMGDSDPDLYHLVGEDLADGQHQLALVRQRIAAMRASD